MPDRLSSSIFSFFPKTLLFNFLISIVLQLVNFAKSFLTVFEKNSNAFFTGRTIKPKALATASSAFKIIRLSRSIYIAVPSSTEHSMKICSAPPPISIPSENTDTIAATPNSTSASAFLPDARLITRNISYRPPSAKPSSTDAAICAS